jgi:hypothetical protein
VNEPVLNLDGLKAALVRLEPRASVETWEGVEDGWVFTLDGARFEIVGELIEDDLPEIVRILRDGLRG